MSPFTVGLSGVDVPLNRDFNSLSVFFSFPGSF